MTFKQQTVVQSLATSVSQLVFLIFEREAPRFILQNTGPLASRHAIA
jgi:hypothetical protein